MCRIRDQRAGRRLKEFVQLSPCFTNGAAGLVVRTTRTLPAGDGFLNEAEV